MSILKQGDQVDKYRVEYAIKTNAYCETYRVADDDGNPYFMKLYIIKNTPKKLLTDEGKVLEIEYSKRIKHKNIISYIDSGTLMIPEGVCHYMINIYFHGEILAEKVEREGPLKLEEAKQIFTGVLEALKYLHGELHLCHNDITPANIMLSAQTGGEPELIDMGHLSPPVDGNTAPFDTSDLDPAYCDNRTFLVNYKEATDVFSAVAVFYFLLTGIAPWNISFEPGTPRAQAILSTKSKRKSPLDLDGIDEQLINFFQRGLAGKNDERFKSANEVLQLLKDPSEVKPPKNDSSSGIASKGNSSRNEQEEHTAIDVRVQRGGGNGFKDIAGMEDMKQMLQQRVIFILQDKEIAKQYRLTPPNGMLLYGPPGCGKSFFAEKFAEETGFAFIYVKASDLGSVYIHGTQGKIAELFKLAEKNAPTVLCFDEFDAFVPDRTQDLGNHHAGEVNEFLSQLNNCSKRGIFVIASTNRPDMVDPAVLRTGRIDKLVYVPLPDYDARREMLALYMKDRPADEINYERLAELSDGYIASDIAYIVNEAATIAAFKREHITQELMETTIQAIKPSLKPERLREYEALREKMEGIGRGAALPHVGFDTKQSE